MSREPDRNDQWTGDDDQVWKPIMDHDGSDRPCLFASYYVPSDYTQQNGSKPGWCYGYGIKFGVWWTGIFGGNPSHFKYINGEKP